MAGVSRWGLRPLFSTLDTQIGVALMAAICLFAALAGGAPQRWTALVVAIGWVGSAALQDKDNLIEPEWGTFVLDFVLLLIFVWIAVRWGRGWSIAVASFQLLTLCTHIAIMIDLRIAARAYVTAYLAWSYLLLLAVVWGGVAGLKARGAAKREELIGD